MIKTSYATPEKPAHMPQQTFDQLRQKAVELEGVFLSTLMSQVTSSASAQGPFGGGYAEETWRGMLSTQYANDMARAGGIGLSDSILRDLIGTQSVAGKSQYHQVPPAGAYQK